MADGMRHSRIRHPPGGRFIRLDLWAVEELGHAGAATLAVLEFWDQLRDGPYEWMQRDVADLVGALKGLYARDKVRAARRDLVARGWLEEDPQTVFDGQLYRSQTWMRLRPDRINAWIDENIEKSKKCEKSHSGNAENRPTGVRKSARTTNSTSTPITTPTPPPPASQAGDTEPAGAGSGEGGETADIKNPQAGQGEGVVGLEALERLQQGLAAAIIPLIVNLPLERAQALVDRLVGDMREGGVKRPVDLFNYWIGQGDDWAQSAAGAAVAKAREAAAKHQAALAAQPQIDEHAVAIGTALLPPNMAARAAGARRMAGLT